MIRLTPRGSTGPDTSAATRQDLAVTMADGVSTVWGLGILAGELPELSAIAAIPMVGWMIAICLALGWIYSVIWC